MAAPPSSPPSSSSSASVPANFTVVKRLDGGIHDVTLSITGSEVRAEVQIFAPDQLVLINISHLFSYQFLVHKWRGRGFATLATLFFLHTQRDSKLYGTYTHDNLGNLEASPLTTQQRDNILLQASVDVLVCLSKIAEAQTKHVHDYALWYIETQEGRETNTYSQYITMITCHCIVDSQFFNSGLEYVLTEF